MATKLTQEEVIKRFKEKHGDRYDYSLVKYIKNDIKVEVICKTHGPWLIKSWDHAQGHGCIKCRNESLKNLKYTKDSILLKCKEKHNERYDYSLINEFKGITNKYKFICKKHNNTFETTFPIHLNGDGGCRKCMYEKNSQTNKINLDYFISESNLIHDNKYNYSKVEYKNNSTKIKIICPKHGVFEQRPHAHKDLKQGCPKCKERKGERIIRKYLECNSIKYIFQHSFDNCRNINRLFFDFYIPHLNICIEFDGEQHYKPIKFFGGLENHKYISYNDNIKNNYCKDNNIKLIRIPYYKIKDINKILEKSLI